MAVEQGYDFKPLNSTLTAVLKIAEGLCIALAVKTLCFQGLRQMSLADFDLCDFNLNSWLMDDDHPYDHKLVSLAVVFSCDL